MQICTKELAMAFVIMLGSITNGCVGIYPSAAGAEIRFLHHLSDTSIEFTLYNSAVFFFAIFGPFVTLLLLKVFKGSRKITVFVLDVFTAISWFLNCLTKINIWAGVFTRGLLGLAIGAYSSIGSMYLIEIAPPSISGFYGSLNQIGIVIGQALYSFIAPSVDYMGLNYIGGATNVLGAILIWFVIESPAIANNDVQTEKRSESILQKKYFNGLLIGVTLMFMQQFCGINGILTNLSDIMNEAGLDLNPNYQSGISILSQLISVFIGSSLIDKLGRKKCWIISSSISAVSLFIYALDEKFNWSNVLPLICIFCYQLGFGLGLGPIPWFIVPEYFDVDVRSKATMVCVCTNWIFAFTIVMAFPSMKKSMGLFGSMLFFLVVLVLSVLFGIFKITEPKINNNSEAPDDQISDSSESAPDRI